VPGLTYPYFFEATPQSLLGQPNTLQIAVAGNQPNWGGCKIYVSNDGTTYSYVGTVYSQGRTGLISAALPIGADPDTTNTLSVDTSISGGELVTVTAAQANNFATLSALVSPSGAIELISYETATLTAQNRYNLTYLRRGVYGTTIGSFPVGSTFSYIGTSGVENYQYPAQYVGEAIYFKFASFNLMGNQLQDLSQCIPYEITIEGSSLQNPSGGLFSVSPNNVLSSAVSGSLAVISVANFTARLNNQSVACAPLAVTPSPVGQNRLYYLYYIDKAFAGGNIQPIATTEVSDFQGKSGYYPIGDIVTVISGNPVYRPSTWVDAGSISTKNPRSCINSSIQLNVTGAPFTSVQGSYQFGGSSLPGLITYFGDPYIIPSYTTTLTVSLQASANVAPGSTCTTTVSYSLDAGVTFTTLYTRVWTAGGTDALTNPPVTLPSGINLANVQVQVSCSCTAPTGIGTSNAEVNVYNIWVQ